MMTQQDRRDVPEFCDAQIGQPSDDQQQTQRRSVGTVLDGFLNSPFAGIAPWAVLSILSAPGRFEVAAVSAFSFSLVVMLVGALRGIKIHLLEVFGAVFFGFMAVMGVFATESVIRFLELWAGELTNISLAAFAWLSLLIRRPFTMAYAKETTPQQHWNSPLFKRINDVITAAWAGAFTLAAAVGFVGDYVLHDAGNFWTGWILQLAAIFAAVAVTEFYPDYATAKFDLANGEAAQLPSMITLIEWLPMFLTVTGIAGLVTDALDLMVGVAFIIVGSIASGIVAKRSPSGN